MIMPKMSGREVIDALRQLDPDVHILVCSGFAPDEEILGLCKDKSIGFLHKPYLARELAEAIQRLQQRV
jgi:DNA-binding NarL/FixJ family response regulator